MRMVLMLLAAVMMISSAGTAGSAPAPAEYGRVVISNYSQKTGLAPVVFDHWVHRTQYTCRLCHVDIGFAMKANLTEIRAADNSKGVYCGVCHNGKMQAGGTPVFAACSTDRSDMKRCERCHSQGKSVKKDKDFATATAGFPKDKFGNGINWEKAAEDGLITLVDHIEGVSIKKPARPIEKDFSLKPKSQGMNEIIFSHKKHTVWNGCEVCHPDIFAGGKKGSTKYSMKEIEEGKFCGVCHGTVAFPQADCNRCHSKPVK